MRLSVDEVEPEAMLRFEGASALTAGPTGLENLVIADIVFGLDRRITPVLAWAFLGVLPERSR